MGRRAARRRRASRPTEATARYRRRAKAEKAARNRDGRRNLRELRDRHAKTKMGTSNTSQVDSIAYGLRTGTDPLHPGSCGAASCVKLWNQCLGLGVLCAV